MRRKLWALTLIVIIVIAVAAFIFLYRVVSGSGASGLNVPVGVFLYLWYGNATTGVGGLESPGWNSSTYPGGGAAVDTPAIGYYVSDSNATFQWQVKEMQSAGISFAVISWSGPSRTGEAGAINKATFDFFRFLKGTNSDFKAAIMVDAFEGGNNLNESTLSSVYNYVFSQFASTYSNWYFSWEGHPLLLFFNPIYPQANDTRLTVRTIGNRPNPIDWQFWNAPGSFFQSQLQPGVDAVNDIGSPFISSDGEVTIVPRVDSYYNNQSGYQEGYLRFDPTLQLGLYQAEWSFVLSHRSEVKLVLIYSWNEYHERSAIEPHSDKTSTEGDSYLLNITAAYLCGFRISLSLSWLGLYNCRGLRWLNLEAYGLAVPLKFIYFAEMSRGEGKSWVSTRSLDESYPRGPTSISRVCSSRWLQAGRGLHSTR